MVIGLRKPIHGPSDFFNSWSEKIREKKSGKNGETMGLKKPIQDGPSEKNGESTFPTDVLGWGRPRVE